ncbi:MAG TPA: hypothetical protein VMF57_02790 [Solirubrobacteraceae bacterium]|nr:hypothetical protein [Solirubrobacteraceae bacterium]
MGNYLIVLVILAAVVVFVSAPMRRAVVGGHSSEGGAGSGSGSLVEASEVNLEELEAAREAKYRELRDAELDHRTGKLSDEDYEALDRTLRGEAIEILRGLDREHARIESPDSDA